MKQFRPTPGLVLAFIAVFLLGSGSAVAGSVINGKKIKKKSIPLSALSPAAVKALKGQAGPQGPPGASAVRYWAYVTASGSVGRSSGGITSALVTNGGTNHQYQVHFPADVSQCGYIATNGDTAPIGQSESVFGNPIGVTRSNVDSSTVAVHIWKRDTIWNSTNAADMIEDSFYIAVMC